MCFLTVAMACLDPGVSVPAHSPAANQSSIEERCQEWKGQCSSEPASVLGEDSEKMALRGLSEDPLLWMQASLYTPGKTHTMHDISTKI
jgi:hypothetical protein